MNTTTTQHNLEYYHFKPISWNAIFAGVVLSLALEALMNLLGLGLGFTAFEFDGDTIANIGLSSTIWLIVSGTLDMLIRGWVAGRLASCNHNMEGALHGLIAWGLATLLTFMLMATSAGSLISGTTNIIGHGLSAVGKGTTAIGKGAMQIAPQAADMVNNMSPNMMPELKQFKERVAQVINNAPTNNQQSDTATSAQSPQAIKENLQQAVMTILTGDNENDKATARQNVVNILTQNSNMSQQQAEQTLNDWQQQYDSLKAQIAQKTEQAKQKAAAATEKASKILGTIAITTFFAFLLSAISGTLGGLFGARNRAKKFSNERPLPLNS